jgi:hypothetical protein
MTDKPHKNYTYTIKIDPVKYRGVMQTTLTLPVDLDFIVEKKLDAMNGNYSDVIQILKRIKDERKD